MRSPFSLRHSVLGAARGPTQSAPFSPAPDAYWSLVEGIVGGQVAPTIGTDAIVGVGGHITLVTGASPRGGPVLRFDGAEPSPPAIGNAGAWAPSNGNTYTFGGWFYAPFTDSGVKAFFRHPHAPGGSGPGLVRSISGSLCGYTPVNNASQYMPAIYDPAVPHWVLTAVTKGGSQSFSVDGGPFGYPGDLADSPGSTVYLGMGNSSPVFTLNGDLADIVMWKRALTNDEAAAAYAWIQHKPFA